MAYGEDPDDHAEVDPGADRPERPGRLEMLDQQSHEMRFRFAKDHQQALWREASDERLARAAQPARHDLKSRLADGWHVLALASLSAARHLSLPHDHAPRRRFAHGVSH